MSSFTLLCFKCIIKDAVGQVSVLLREREQEGAAESREQNDLNVPCYLVAILILNTFDTQAIFLSDFLTGDFESLSTKI